MVTDGYNSVSFVFSRKIVNLNCGRKNCQLCLDEQNYWLRLRKVKVLGSKRKLSDAYFQDRIVGHVS